MLSNMESHERLNHDQITAHQAEVLLRTSREAQRTIAGGLQLPPGYSLATGIANAVLVAGVAVGNSEFRFGGAVFAATLAVVFLLQRWAIQRFRALNGVWIGGHQGGRRTWFVMAVFVATLMACVLAATLLTVRHHGWLAALVAVLTIPLTFVVDRWWMSRCRAAAGSGATS
jgi:hypothetical protein